MVVGIVSGGRYCVGKVGGHHVRAACEPHCEMRLAVIRHEGEAKDTCACVCAYAYRALRR